MEETGAESMRQLPTLTLFKINMNLEMEKGTDALAAAVEAAPPRELERQPYDEDDIATIRAMQGPMEAVERPYDAAAAELGIPTEALLERLREMVERKLLRRVAAILYHRRAGFSANGMGVWKVPEEEIMETGAADGLLPRHLPLLPAADLRGLALQRLHDGPRPLEGGVRRDPRLDRRRVRDGRPRTAPPSTPRPSTRRSACITSPTTIRGGKLSTRSSELYERALRVLPGGVNSPVRAMRQIGREPIFVERGEGCELVDVDGNRYLDWVGSWGPLILGHAHPAVVEAVAEAAVARHAATAPRPPPRSSWPSRSSRASPRSRCCG